MFNQHTVAGNGEVTTIDIAYLLNQHAVNSLSTAMMCCSTVNTASPST